MLLGQTFGWSRCQAEPTLKVVTTQQDWRGSAEVFTGPSEKGEVFLSQSKSQRKVSSLLWAARIPSYFSQKGLIFVSVFQQSPCCDLCKACATLGVSIPLAFLITLDLLLKCLWYLYEPLCRKVVRETKAAALDFTLCIFSDSSLAIHATSLANKGKCYAAKPGTTVSLWSTGNLETNPCFLDPTWNNKKLVRASEHPTQSNSLHCFTSYGQD